MADVGAEPVYRLTNLETHAMGWAWWPPMVERYARHARAAGWGVRVGFSRVGTRDTIGIWLDGYGHRGAVFWCRLHEGANRWTTDGARMSGTSGKLGHTEVLTFLRACASMSRLRDDGVVDKWMTTG